MAMRISVIDERHPRRWPHRRRRHHRMMLNFLQNTVNPMLEKSQNDDDTSGSYPWCFIFSDKKSKKNNFYIGALTASRNRDSKINYSVLFSRLSYDRILAEFNKKFHLAFWQARILATLQSEATDSQEGTYLHEWVSALQRHYSPFLESIFIRKDYRFSTTSESLLLNCHILDNQIPLNGGVEFMPWKNWPECIQSGDFVWLWRQSRHGRIIDSTKISIPMDITNARR